MFRGEGVGEGGAGEEAVGKREGGEATRSGPGVGGFGTLIHPAQPITPSRIQRRHPWHPIQNPRLMHPLRVLMASGLIEASWEDFH